MRVDTRADQLGFVSSLRGMAAVYPHRAPPIPLWHPELGGFGRLEAGGVFRDPRALSDRQWQALCRDEQAFIRRRAQQAREVYHALQITSFDNVISQRRNGFADDKQVFKVTTVTAATAWSSLARTAGVPVALTYTAIPTGAVMNAATAGAVPLRFAGVGLKKWLLNCGVNMTTGTNVMLLVDLLWAGGNILANSAAAQTVNSAALTRYSGTAAAGNMMTLEVTTALGATAQNVTVSYVNQAGSAQTTIAQAMTPSSAVQRLNPVAAGPAIQLNSGVAGVRSISTVQFSAANSAGALAANIYRPLLFVPTIATTTFVERSTPSAIGGMLELVAGSDSQHGCLVPYVLASTTATGVVTMNLQCVDES